MSQEITWGNQGWYCPRCGRGLAPWVSECPCYREPPVTYSSSSSTAGLPSNINDHINVYDEIRKTMINPKINYTHQDSITHAEGNNGNLS